MKKFKKSLALLLALVMCLGCMSVGVWADSTVSLTGKTMHTPGNGDIYFATDFGRWYPQSGSIANERKVEEAQSTTFTCRVFASYWDSENSENVYPKDALMNIGIAYGSDVAELKVEKDSDGYYTVTLTPSKSGIVKLEAVSVDTEHLTYLAENEYAYGSLIVTFNLPTTVAEGYTTTPPVKPDNRTPSGVSYVYYGESVGTRFDYSNGAMVYSHAELDAVSIKAWPDAFSGGSDIRLRNADIQFSLVSGEASFSAKWNADGYYDLTITPTTYGTVVIEGWSTDETGYSTYLGSDEYAYRYALSKGYDVSGKAELGSFTDSANVSGYAADAMAWAVESGIIEGVGDNLLDPLGNATRAQLATMLMRFHALYTAEV